MHGFAVETTIRRKRTDKIKKGLERKKSLPYKTVQLLT